MKSYKHIPISHVIKDLGARSKAARVNQDLKQIDLAEHAGVSLQPIKSLEKGDNISLENFLKILRSLNCISEMEQVIPEDSTSPKEYILNNKKSRKRVR